MAAALAWLDDCKAADSPAADHLSSFGLFVHGYVGERRCWSADRRDRAAGLAAVLTQGWGPLIEDLRAVGGWRAAAAGLELRSWPRRAWEVVDEHTAVAVAVEDTGTVAGLGVVGPYIGVGWMVGTDDVVVASPAADIEGLRCSFAESEDTERREKLGYV